MRKKSDADALSQAIAEPSRRALLENLRYGQKTVTELVQATQLKQPNVSNHLAKMRQQGIVRAERIGRQVHYSLALPFTEVLLRMHEFAANPDVEGALALSAPSHALSAEEASPASTHLPPIPTPEQPSHTIASEVPETQIAAWRDAYFHSIMAGKEDQATALVNAMLTRRLPMETIYTQIFQQAINHVGELFQQGVTDEAHEHMASAMIERMMARIAQFYTPVARANYCAVLGSVAENWHILGLRMLADGLKAHGWETIFLGANVPTQSFIAMTRHMRPDLVIVSCAMEDQTAEARTLLEGLDALRRSEAEIDFQVAVGGHYFHAHPEQLQTLPVDFTANDLNEFLQIVASRYVSPRSA